MTDTTGVPTAGAAVCVGPPKDAGAFVGGLETLGSPHGDALDEVLAELEWLRVPAGVELFRAGAPGDGMYLVYSGRLRAFDVSADGSRRAIADFARREVVGEAALLTGQPRSASVMATRDSVVARLSVVAFERLVASHPRTGLSLARLVARRLAERRLNLPSWWIGVTAVVSNGGADAAKVAASLVAELARSDRVRVVAPPAGAPADAALVAAAEHDTAGSVVVDLTDRPGIAPGEVALADRLVLVVDGRGAVQYADDELLRVAAGAQWRQVELVLVHPRWVRLPSGAQRWRAIASFEHIHHVRADTPGDVARLSRLLTGQGVGLVLGGGGARGFAHVGVIRAMRDLAIPIDRIGGSSMGAYVGAMVAMGWEPYEMIEHCRRLWRLRDFRRDLTIPTVSLLSGKRIRKVYRATFGDAAIEDLWLDLFCTSVDITACRLEMHDRGPLSHWVMASSSVPGLWPPVVDDAGHLHIDGGNLDNVPVGIMRREHDGPVVAVDVCSDQASMQVSPGRVPRTGIGHLLERRLQARYPNLTDLLNRAALVSSLRLRDEVETLADAYVAPDCAAYGMVSFNRIEQIERAGYDAAMAALGHRADLRLPPGER